MINVKLIAETNKSPKELVAHAAKTCYTSETPKMGTEINIKDRLFTPGHHTTLQHNYFTFAIEGISVGAVTFGLHLASPFYNTDQRSGRYSKMYYDSSEETKEEYKIRFSKDAKEKISNHYSDLENNEKVMQYVESGADIYLEYIDKATEIAAKQLKKERPFASDKAITMTSKKIAQEQLRNFISIIAPTGLDFTIDISALAALHRTAWTSELRDVVGKMKDAVIKKHPDISYMFEEDVTRKNDWAPSLENMKICVKDAPELQLLAYDIDESAINLENYSKDSVDTNYFTPEKMENNINTIKTGIEISIATMGQDQRHRVIRRTAPEFTGAFYLPELMQQLPGLKDKADDFISKWAEISKEIPSTLAPSIAPYGAMVKYEKLSDINGLQHEQGKRTCWCAQEEIYWVAALTRQALEEKGLNKLCEIFAPACYKDGKCIEGDRFCGRNLKQRKDGNYFEHRLV